MMDMKASLIDESKRIKRERTDMLLEIKSVKDSIDLN